MPASYDAIVLHAVWGTKYRQPWIDANVEEALYGKIRSQFIHYGCIVYAVGGTPDHVHVVFTLPRTTSVADLLRKVKSASSGWIDKQHSRYKGFSWQRGYGVFSVDYRRLDGIVAYVNNQKKHHGITMPEPTEKIVPIWESFREELTAILIAYGHADFTPEYFFPDPPGTPGILNEPSPLPGSSRPLPEFPF